MRKGIVISLLLPCILLLAAALVFFIFDASRQRSVVFESSGELADQGIGVFPLDRTLSEVELSRGLRFKISSTTSLSSLSRPTIEKLKSQGLVVDSSSTILFGRTMKYGIKVYTKTFTVDLPLATYRVTTDTASGRKVKRIDVNAPQRYLRGVDFVEGAPDLPDALGVDFLTNYALAYSMNDTTLTFYTSFPAGYEKCGVITEGHSPNDMIGTGARFYMDMKVDHEHFTFLINTALKDVTIKMPLENMRYRNENVDNEYLTTITNAKIEAMVDRDAWCEFGNRAGGRTVYYYNDQSDVYEINPIRFFGQDMVLDLKNHLIGFRPTYDINYCPVPSQRSAL